MSEKRSKTCVLVILYKVGETAGRTLAGETGDITEPSFQTMMNNDDKEGPGFGKTPGMTVQTENTDDVKIIRVLFMQCFFSVRYKKKIRQNRYRLRIHFDS